MRRTLGFLLAAAALVMALDLVQKQLAIADRSEGVYLNDRPVSYVIAGAALSLGWAGAIALTRSALIAVPGGVVLGGAVGNLIDRAFQGYVTDLFDFRLIHFPVFNVADSAISVGVALLAWYTLTTPEEKPRSAEVGPTAPVAPPTASPEEPQP